MKDLLKRELLKYTDSFTAEDLEKGLPFFETKSFRAKDHILKAGVLSNLRLI